MKFALKQTPLQVQQTAAGKARPAHIWYHTALAHLIEKKFVKKWCSLVMLGTLQERLHFPVLQNKVSTPNFQRPCSFKEEIHKKITEEEITQHDDPISFENCGAYYLPLQTRFRTTPSWPKILVDME